MLDLTQFSTPLVNFQRGAPVWYYRKYPAYLQQTFPMNPIPPPIQNPMIYKENIRQYPYDKFGNRLYYVTSKQPTYRINIR